MPLPKLPAHTTARYRLNYVAAGLQHSIVVHMDTGTTSADAVTLGTALANLLRPVMGTDCQFQGIDFAGLGSDVFNPAATLTLNGTGTGTTTAQSRPYYLNFAGRSPSGRKTRLFLFGVGQPTDANWRYLTTESPAIASIVSGLNADTGGVRCIDASRPSWKPYANCGAHDHYVKRIRRTG